MAELNDSSTTGRLLDELRTGDRATFDRLFARYDPYVRRFVQLRMDDRLRARLDMEDIVQETYTGAFRRMDDYLGRRPLPFRLWLRQIAMDQLRDAGAKHIHAARRTTQREMVLPDASSIQLVKGFLARSASPSRQAVRQELAANVRQALAQLNEADREILIMRYVEKLSNVEVGLLLELDPGAVSKRHGRALLRLQRQLLKFGIGSSDT